MIITNIDFKDSIITIYQNTNRPPVAVINGPYNGNARKSITFLSVGSNDPDIGDSITYNWNFGDGKTSTDKNPTHKYSSVGNYTVTLTVVDQSGETDAITTYALIKSSSSDNDSPGFELLSILIPIMLIVYIKKRNKK